MLIIVYSDPQRTQLASVCAVDRDSVHGFVDRRLGLLVVKGRGLGKIKH